LSQRTTRYCASCLTTFFDDPDACPNLGCSDTRPAQGWGALLGPGDLLDRHYAVERVLAVGGAGLTYLAREADASGEPTGPRLAIKVLYTARDTGPFLRRLANEAQILQELAHDHIVECHGFVHRQGQEPYLVTLFEEGGSLRQHIERLGPLPPEVAVGILRQVLLALDVAHQRAVVHRDLKPDNVLLRQRVDVDQVPHVRVADFGIAKVRGGLTDRLTKLGSFVGTPEYAAPEQFEGLQPTPAADLFAAGGLLWFLLTATPPVTFSARNDLASSYEELLDQVPPKLDGASHQIKSADHLHLLQEVLDQLMCHDAERRWTVHQVLHHLMPLLGDLAIQRAVSTLEFTDAGAPHRNSSPTFTLGPDDPVPDGPLQPPPVGPPTTADDHDPTDAPAPPRSAAPADPTEEEPTTAPFVPESDTAVPVEGSASNTLDPESAAPPTPPRPRSSPVPPPAPADDAATRWVQPPRGDAPEPFVAPPAAPTASGGVGRAAGCLGLSFMGVAMSSAAGLAAVALVGLGAAWAFGWLGGVTVLEPVTVGPTAPKEWEEVPHMLGRNDKARGKRLEVQEAVSTKARGLADRCDAEGPVLAELLITPRGRVDHLRVDPEGWSPSQRRCIEDALRGADLELRTPRDARVRVAFYLR
jgi:serine/threonine-protein kinase